MFKTKTFRRLMILLSLICLCFKAQAQQMPQPTSQDWTTYNINLAIVKAQLQHYKDLYNTATGTIETLKQQLASHSTSSNNSSAEEQAEIAKLTQQLAGLQSLAKDTEALIAAKELEYQALLKKTDTDYQNKISALQNENFWLKVGIVAATIITAGTITYAAIR
jgi:chromosome segregation ATPase